MADGKKLEIALMPLEKMVEAMEPAEAYEFLRAAAARLMTLRDQARDKRDADTLDKD